MSMKRFLRPFSRNSSVKKANTNLIAGSMTQVETAMVNVSVFISAAVFFNASLVV